MHNEKFLQMEKVLELIQLKNEDLESLSRRNNLRIVGILESTHIEKVENFVEDLLKKTFSNATFTPLFVVERAHRSLGP